MNYIYKITNKINDKVYIGQTNNAALRWSQHKSAAKYIPKQLVDKAIKKYGEQNFIYEVIDTCQSQFETDIQETWFIKVYYSLISEHGYNVTLGGMKLIHTPEIREKISHSKKKYFETHINKLKGKKLSEEWKQNISLASMGKPGTNNGKKFSDEHKLKMSKSQPKENLKTRRFSSEIEQEICKLYVEEKIGTTILAKRFGCYSSLILFILKRNNIVPIRKAYFIKKSKYTPEQETQICENYISGMKTLSEISRIYNIPKTSIRCILTKNYLLKG